MTLAFTHSYIYLWRCACAYTHISIESWLLWTCNQKSEANVTILVHYTDRLLGQGTLWYQNLLSYLLLSSVLWITGSWQPPPSHANYLQNSLLSPEWSLLFSKVFVSHEMVFQDPVTLITCLHIKIPHLWSEGPSFSAWYSEQETSNSLF